MADPHSPDPAMPGDAPLSTADFARAGDATRREDEAATTRPAGTMADSTAAPLLPDHETSELRARWDAIQTSFVDEPRRAVEEADVLVAGAMKRLAEVFASERAQLESQWDRGDDVSTEDLRIALQRYRAFFGRLLSI